MLGDSQMEHGEYEADCRSVSREICAFAIVYIDLDRYGSSLHNNDRSKLLLEV